MTTHQPPLKLLWWFPALVVFWGCLCLMPPTLLAHCSPGAGTTPSPAWPSCGLAACADGQPSQTAAPASLGRSFLPKSSLPLPSWGHRCLPPPHTLRSGCPDVATVLLVPLINTSLQVPAVSRPVVLPSEVRLAGEGHALPSSCSLWALTQLLPAFQGKIFVSDFSSSARVNLDLTPCVDWLILGRTTNGGSN